MIAGRTITLIIVALRSAVVLIEEAAGIEEKKTIKDPKSPLVYQKVQAKTPLMNNALEPN